MSFQRNKILIPVREILNTSLEPEIPFLLEGNLGEVGTVWIFALLLSDAWELCSGMALHTFHNSKQNWNHS